MTRLWRWRIRDLLRAFLKRLFKWGYLKLKSLNFPYSSRKICILEIGWIAYISDLLDRFWNNCQKPNISEIILTNCNGSKQCDEPIRILAVTCNLLKAREKSRGQGAIGFSCHWSKTWREIFAPITKRSNHNRAFTFDRHLKTATKMGLW